METQTGRFFMVLCCIVCTLSLLSPIPISTATSEEEHTKKLNDTAAFPKIFLEPAGDYARASKTYKNHTVIKIDGDDALAVGTGGITSGNGTADDPYVIGGWKIDGNYGWLGVYIGNTTKNIVIRDCLIQNASKKQKPIFEGAGIYLRNVTNITVERTTCENNYHGMRIMFSTGVVVRNCTTVNSSYNGITLQNCKKSKFERNELRQSFQYGMYLSTSNENTVIYNLCRYNLNGICFDGSSKCIVHNNSFSNNGGFGVYFSGSAWNVLSYNNISNNFDYGIYVSSSYYKSRFHHNNFYGNCPGKAQAKDDGNNNFWNETNGGNYWNDWVSPDNDSDGIVDIPYKLDGPAKPKDFKPLAEPVPTSVAGPIAEFTGSRGMTASILLAAAICVLFTAIHRRVHRSGRRLT